MRTVQNNKSLDYVKNRVLNRINCNLNVSEKAEWGYIPFELALEAVGGYDEMRKCSSKELNMLCDICYQPDLEPQYFTHYGMYSDGTIDDLICIKECIGNVTSYESCYIPEVKKCSKPLGSAEGGHFYNIGINLKDVKYIEYIVGDIVISCETNDRFSSKEKPWMKQYTVAYLPVRMGIHMKTDLDRRTTSDDEANV